MIGWRVKIRCLCLDPTWLRICDEPAAFPYVADILVNSVYDPDKEEVAAFEEFVVCTVGWAAGRHRRFLCFRHIGRRLKRELWAPAASIRSQKSGWPTWRVKLNASRPINYEQIHFSAFAAQAGYRWHDLIPALVVSLLLAGLFYLMIPFLPPGLARGVGTAAFSRRICQSG